MSSHKNIFVSFLIFALSVTFVLPAQATFADDGDASSTSDQVLPTASITPPIELSIATSSTPSIESATTTATTTTPILPSPVTVTLDIETATTTLFDQSISVQPCASDQTNTTQTVNGYCALEQSGLPLTWNWYGSSAFLDTVGGVGNGSGSDNYWLYFDNTAPGMVGLNEDQLVNGETLLVTIDRMPMELSVSSSSPNQGATTTATVEGFNALNFDYEPVSGAAIVGADATTTDANGRADILVTDSNPLTIHAEATGYLSSNSITITPIANVSASVPITLEIDTATTTLFSGALDVVPCSPQVGDTATANGYCAIQQTGLASTWQWFSGFGAGLVSIAGDGDWNNGPWWSTFSNGQPLSDALNVHTLTAGEHLLATDGPMPLQITVSSTSPTVGATTTVTVEGFNAWDFAYEPLPGATLVGVDADSTDANGQTIITATSTDPFTIYATDGGYLNSNAVTITATSTSSDTGGGTGGTGGGGGGSTSTSINIPAAFSFLQSQQSGSGSFSSDEYTDWAALALALPDAPSSARTLLASYLTSERPQLSVVKDFERHTMALMALGINPYTGAGVDYVSPIVNAFNGTNIGSDDFEANNEIFALMVLPKLGYSSNDPIVSKSVAYVVSQQNADGGWSSPDLTGAGLQALTQLSSLPGVSAALSKAESYLHAQQQPNGGFGNPESTSWVIGGIDARGESPTSWTINGTSTPLTSLAAAQQGDGRVSSGFGDVGYDLWTTEYALTAAEGRTWPSLLNSFNGQTSGSTSTASSTATSTSAFATTTPVIATATDATSTPPILPAMVTPPVAAVGQIDGDSTDVPDFQSTATSADASSTNTLGAAAANAPAAHSLWYWILSVFSWFGAELNKIF